jgi:hypothetical protein
LHNSGLDLDISVSLKELKSTNLRHPSMNGHTSGPNGQVVQRYCKGMEARFDVVLRRNSAIDIYRTYRFTYILNLHILKSGRYIF